MTTTTKKTLRSRTLLAACIVLLAFAFAACSSSSKSDSSGSAGTPAVTIADLKFTTTPVKAGATVTVKNNDDVTHTVTSDDGSSFNVTVQENGTATFTAPDKAGTYKFHCNIHSTMHGTLTVS